MPSHVDLEAHTRIYVEQGKLEEEFEVLLLFINEAKFPIFRIDDWTGLIPFLSHLKSQESDSKGKGDLSPQHFLHSFVDAPSLLLLVTVQVRW